MKYIFSTLCILILFNCNAQTISEKELVEQRALEFIRYGFVLSIQEYTDKKISQEYVHPESNDSGISYIYPEFVPEIKQQKGLYIINNINDVEILGSYSGRSKYVLNNKQEIYFVQISYKTIAGYSFDNDKAGIVFYQKPVIMKKYIIMAFDSSDNKWKYVDTLP